jgi:hypothetical protein
MCAQPVADQENLVLREVSVVEHEQKLAPLLQPLDRMRLKAGGVREMAGIP